MPWARMDPHHSEHESVWVEVMRHLQNDPPPERINEAGDRWRIWINHDLPWIAAETDALINKLANEW